MCFWNTSRYKIYENQPVTMIGMFGSEAYSYVCPKFRITRYELLNGKYLQWRFNPFRSFQILHIFQCLLKHSNFKHKFIRKFSEEVSNVKLELNSETLLKFEIFIFLGRSVFDKSYRYPSELRWRPGSYLRKINPPSRIEHFSLTAGKAAKRGDWLKSFDVKYE